MSEEKAVEEAPLYVSDKDAPEAEAAPEPKVRKKATPKRPKASKRQVIASRKLKKAVRRAGGAAERREVVEDLLEDLEDQEVEESEDNRPGRKIRGSKVSWTEQDIKDRWPIISFIPEWTGPLNFQGVRYQAIAGREMHVPSVIKRIYDNRIREKMDHPNAMPRDTGFETVVQIGAGALGPDTSISQ